MCDKKFCIVCSSPRGTGIVFDAKCGAWKCKQCGQDLRRKWLQRAIDAFERFPLWQYARCSKAAFDALSRRLRKRNRLYLRIRIGDVSHVFHQPLLSTRQYKPDRSKWFSASKALSDFEDLLMMPTVLRVSCSVVLQTREQKSTSKWKREAVKHGGIVSVNAFLNRVCVNETVAHARAFSKEILDVILLRGFSSDLPLTDPSFTEPEPGTEKEVDSTRSAECGSLIK